MSQSAGITISAVATVLVIGFGFLIWRAWLKNVQPQQRAIAKIKKALADIHPQLQAQSDNCELIYTFAELCVNLHKAEQELGLYAREEAVNRCREQLNELAGLVKALSKQQAAVEPKNLE